MSTQPPPALAPAPLSILSPSIPTAFPAPAGCSGDGCLSRDPWPLHSVKHRDAICRLCTGCVLKYHPSQFCSLCLDLISDPTSAASESASVINCSSCNNVSHSSCLPPSSSSTSPDFFLCPACTSNPNPSQTDSSKRRIIDVNYAKSMVCAARISASSMSRAAAQARGEADRKVKEAIVARKRAREMLDSVIVIARREKETKTNKEKFTRFYTTTNNNNSNNNNNGKNNNNEGIGGLERKIAPLNSRVGKVEEQVESKDIKPVAILPRSDGNQIS